MSDCEKYFVGNETKGDSDIICTRWKDSSETFYRGIYDCSIYKDFMYVEESDKKINTLSANNNVYRSMVSVCFCTIIVKAYELKLRYSLSVIYNGNFEFFFILMVFLYFSIENRLHMLWRVDNALNNIGIKRLSLHYV